ncbi:MAG TPA: STAS domain-containing protein [Anaerolineales bacterium]
MELFIRQLNQAGVVSITGSVDALTSGELTKFMLEQIQSGQRQLVADLSQVEFMSSAGLRAILAAFKESRQQGGDLRLANAQPGVQKLLKLAGFTNIIRIYPTVQEAVSSFETGSAA